MRIREIDLYSLLDEPSSIIFRKRFSVDPSIDLPFKNQQIPTGLIGKGTLKKGIVMKEPLRNGETEKIELGFDVSTEFIRDCLEGYGWEEFKIPHPHQ